MFRSSRRLETGRAEPSWLRFVLDHAPVILFAFDPQGRFTLHEGRGLDALGLKPGAFVGRSVFEAFADEPALLEHTRRALAGEDFEALTPMRSGLAFSTRFSALRDARGRPAGAVGVALDVTSQRQADEALRVSEARLRLVTEQLPCIVWTTDRDLRITGVAGAAARDLDRALGQRLEHISGVSQCGLDAHHQALGGRSAEYRIEREGRVYDVHVAPFLDEAGAPAGCIGLAVDVTDRARAEATARRLETEQGLLLDAVPAMVCFRDRRGVVLRCNRAFADAFGLDCEEVRGRRLEELLPADARRELALDREVFETGRPRLGVVEACQIVDHRRLWLRMDRMPIRDERGEVTTLLVCCVDVSPLKEVEALLQATLESTADGILVVDRQGRIVVHNQRFAALWGVPDDVLRSRDDARALACVLERLADPAAFLARVGELYADPHREAHDVLELADGRVLERFSRPQHVGGEVVGRVWSFRDVTARRRAEAERDALLATERASRERAQVAERWLRELVHGVDAIVWERRAGSHDFTFVSDGGELILGYPVERWLAPGFWRGVVHDEDLAAAVEALGVMEDRRLELRVRSAGGAFVWFQDNLRVVRDRRGVPTHLRGVMIDISARKRAEEALAASEVRLRAMVENTPNVAIQRYAPDGRVLGWNRASEHIYGVRAGDVVGRRLDEVGVLTPEGGEELARTLARVARTGCPSGPREWPVRRRDGSSAVVLSTIFAVPGRRGDELICMDVDVTRRRRAEEALERHAARLEVLARVSRRLDDASFDVDAVAGALAAGIHEALAERTFVLVLSDDAGAGAAAQGRPLEEGQGALEALARDPRMLGRSALLSGETLAALAPGHGLVSVAVAPLAVHGRVLGVLCVGRGTAPAHGPEALRLFEDLGERAALAVENARHFQAAQDAIRQRDEFLSVASHELRTPLQSLGLVVQGLSAAAAHKGGLEGVPADVIARGLDRVVRQEQRLARLVDALLDVTRLSSGQLHLELEDVDLAQVARDVVELVRGELSAARCALVLDLPRAPVLGRWDRARLEQVLANLLSNASKYGAGRPVEVCVGAERGAATLVVTDHGIGMSQETCRQIFQRFKRGVSARHYGGLGLGLFITRQIVEALGGSVDVHSALGQGSTFTVRLPRGGPAAPEDGPC